ncbi:uncharacterized protein LOC125760057 [Rhipicephalus sanguineus]|uniref:F-box domain-containing protein n=1 Tax=Rhipicephalus sanguineus TaxID=34632 RepID=A0A9D4QFL4_RHISA|nr:uncharacterized protein LOC125760057 [Rhipicephalus sanguineus]KAH7976249.1 hypothetical protein HPB52_010380 [Rhipicephalus sanguineus]
MNVCSCRPQQQPSQRLPKPGAWASKNSDFGCLPREVWLRVLEYLDAESRLNVGDIGPNFKALAVDNEQLLQTVRCDAHCDAASLKWLLALGRWAHVRRLCLNNCIVARPSELLECVFMCEHLTELRCVRCPLDVKALFSTKSLPVLQRLDWTLHCDYQLRRYFEAARVGRFSFALSERLYDMYVEVESAEHPSFEFLAFMLGRSSRMRRLHVHVMLDARRTSVQQCATLALSLLSASLCKFVFTTDEQVTSMCRRTENVPRRPLDLEHDVLVCGNISMHYKGGFSSCIWLDDIVQSGPGNQEQIVLVVDDIAAAHKLDFAAASYTWAKLKALTLVSTIAQARDVPGSPRLCDGIATLLHACGNITELNLNAFHFPEGTSFSSLPQSLGRLRALSVSPCFFMGDRFCLTSLASACSRLQELDVQMNYVGIYKGECGPCRYGSFSLRPNECRTTGKLISLQRLTFSCTAQLNWFAFVNACDVVELRLCGSEFGLCSNLALGVLLTGNCRLYSLLLEDNGLRLDDDLLLRELAKAPNLRYLCLLSNVTLSFEVVEASAGTLVRTLPALEALHVHFRNKFSARLDRMSWIRRGFVHRYEPRSYKATANSSCVLCSTSTFIGLAKPRYRYLGGL